MIGRERRFTALGQFRPAWSKGAEMEPHARGTRPAVKGIGNRPLCRIVADVGTGVGHVENLGLLLRLVFVLVFVFRFVGFFRRTRRRRGASRSALAVFRAFLLAPIAHHHVTGGRAVTDRLAADSQRVLGHARGRFFLLVLLILVPSLRFVLARRGVSEVVSLSGRTFNSPGTGLLV